MFITPKPYVSNNYTNKYEWPEAKEISKSSVNFKEPYPITPFCSMKSGISFKCDITRVPPFYMVEYAIIENLLPKKEDRLNYKPVYLNDAYLQQLSGQDDLKPLEGYVRDTSHHIKERLCKVIGKIGENNRHLKPALSEILPSLLNDSNNEVANEALNALLVVGTPNDAVKGLPHLTDELKSDTAAKVILLGKGNPEIINKIIDGVPEMSNGSGKVEGLAAMLNNKAHKTWVKIDILKILGQMGPEVDSKVTKPLLLPFIGELFNKTSESTKSEELLKLKMESLKALYSINQEKFNEIKECALKINQTPHPWRENNIVKAKKIIKSDNDILILHTMNIFNNLQPGKMSKIIARALK